LIFRTYLPDKVSYVLNLWKTELGKVNEKAGQSLADPAQYENLFPGFQEALKTQQFLAQQEPELLPANAAMKVTMNIDRDVVEEMRKNESQGSFQYSKLDKPENGHEELSASVQKMSLETAQEPAKARKNSLDEFDFEEDLDENIDTSDVNLDDEELLSDD
jgi:coatomer subunit beta'